MKRLSSSDSLGAMMSICPNMTTDGDHNQVNNNNTTPPIVYTPSELQTMLDGLDEEGCCVEESGHHITEKKRRLSVDQVKALEKNFEVENKLEPERKVKLAQELGLQPRQVAVWFQNRRARWKTKNLERDYGVLKSNYDGLKLNYEKLQRDNEALQKEIKELKEKLISEDAISEAIVSDTEEKKPNLEITPPVIINNFLDEEKYSGPEMIKVENFNEDHEVFLCGTTSYVHYDFKKDGSCDDSDSSAIFNEDFNNSTASPKNNAAVSSSSHHHRYLLDNIHSGNAYDYHQNQIVKIEEHNFFVYGQEESCTNLFFDDQAPSLPWYCSEEWS